MKILVTAGNTQALIDRVRCITNIFTGRTGAAIALEAHARGHSVTLLTSHPEAVTAVSDSVPPSAGPNWVVRQYRTFEDLREAMTVMILGNPVDTVVHCAAVSDYLSAGIYAVDGDSSTRFDDSTLHWMGTPPRMLDRAADKVKSDEAELWLRMVRAPKLVDLVRTTWGFSGVLVKFKLEVGLSDNQLLAVAERSRVQSDADLMVANTLEGASEYAFLGDRQSYQRVTRSELASRLLDEIERRVSAKESNYAQ